MLLTPGNSFNYFVSNVTSASTSGNTLTGNTTPNTEGAWVQLLSATAADIYYFTVTLVSGATAATYKSFWLDIGVDNAGGTSYTALVSNLVTSGANISASIGGSVSFSFPLFIKAGSTVAARVQANVASATIGITLLAYGRPSAPHLIGVGTFTETIGLGTAPAATAFTPGNSNAEGSWASLGTTTNDLFWFQLGVQCTDTTMNALVYHFDLAYGDGTNFVMLIENQIIITSTSETIVHLTSLGAPHQKYVPAGSTLYVRGMCSGTSDTGWQAACVGVG